MENHEAHRSQSNRPQQKKAPQKRSKADTKERLRRNQKKRQAAVISVVALLVIGALAAFVAFTHTGLTAVADENSVVTAEMLPEESGFEEFSLMATGDNLLHTKLYTEAAERANNNGYDFTYLYQDVADLTENADLCFINQETPLATAIKEVSSYPMFNTPSETVFALHDIGFNVFNIVSNHSLDQGADGLKATIDVMETVPDSLYVGAYYNKDEMEKPHTIEINGVTVGFVGFTEMTNGLTLDSNSELAFVYTSDEEEMTKLIKTTKENADVVIVSVHWGDENVTSALDRQKQLAQKFADDGADLIIGHHPHVLQEIEAVTSADGRQVPVVYSLGNFTSTMSAPANHVGGFFKCNVIYDRGSGKVFIADEEFIPVINYFTSGKNNIHVIPFADYTEELSANHGLGVTIDYTNELLDTTVGPELLKGDYPGRNGEEDENTEETDGTEDE